MSVTGFTFDGGNTYEKYDYNSLDDLPEVDIGMLSLNTQAEPTTEDGALYAAIVALGWESEVIVSA